MMKSVYILLSLVIVLTSPVRVAQSKSKLAGNSEYGDASHVERVKSGVPNNGDDASLGVERTTHSGSMSENKSELPAGVDSVNQNNPEDGDKVKDISQHDNTDGVNRKDDLDDRSILEGDASEQVKRQRASDGGEFTSLDEELQQDLPDIWSDTGQFVSDILESPIRLEEDPTSSLGIKVGSPSEDEAVECPPPVMLVTPALCGAPACLTHRHCRDPETACCFNGCVHTCLRPLDAPAVIDWLEDTSLIQPMLDEAPGIPKYPMLFEGTSSIAYAQGGGEAVHLQGGCTITSEQYDQLKDYMTRTNIQDCSCTGGEVVCIVKPYKREEED